MPRATFLGTGHYLPEKIVTNNDLAAIMDTSDEWIRQRSGIETRHMVDFDNNPMGSSDLAARAAENALKDANVSKDDIDLIVYATLSADKVFPGDGVLVQAKLDIPAGVPAIDIRNQCSGFLYGLSVANAFIQQGTYQKVLLIGSEVHSSGLDFSNNGRDVSVLFGDGAAACVLGPTEDENSGIMSVHLHADGRFAEDLEAPYPSSAEFPRVAKKELDKGRQYPKMSGRKVFKHASLRMPEAVHEALKTNGFQPSDIDLFIPHQANLRISEMVQKQLGLKDNQVFNNIQKVGNTTACSIPLAMDHARREGRLKSGDLLCLAAFGSGFTWGSALIRWP